MALRLLPTRGFPGGHVLGGKGVEAGHSGFPLQLPIDQIVVVLVPERARLYSPEKPPVV